jgi:DNA-binding IclR family transcriptional regulator
MSQKDPVKTAARTLDVLEAFAEAKTPLTLTEIAERIGSPISSCHALIRTLQARGYLYVLSRRRRCYPTRRLLDIATTIASHDPIVEEIRPLLERVRDATRETVILGKRHGGEIIYLDVAEGLETVRYAEAVGVTKPLHSSAIGKSMTSVMPPAEFEAFLAGTTLAQVTENTVTDIERFRDEIETGRRRGWFMTRGEHVVDVMAIAIVHFVDGEPLGIAVAGPMARMERNRDRTLAVLAETFGEKRISEKVA